MSNSINDEIQEGHLDDAAEEVRKAVAEIEAEKKKNNGYTVVEKTKSANNHNHDGVHKTAHKAPSGDAFTRKVEQLLKSEGFVADGKLTDDELQKLKHFTQHDSLDFKNPNQGKVDGKIVVDEKGAIKEMDGHALLALKLAGLPAVVSGYDTPNMSDNSFSLPSKPRNNQRRV